MKTQKRIRIHQFHDLVAFDCDGMTETLYLEPGDARALARELVRFADSCVHLPTTHPQAFTRIIEDGKATNESDGKSRPNYMPH